MNEGKMKTPVLSQVWKKGLEKSFQKVKRYSAAALSFKDEEDLHQARVNNRRLISFLKLMERSPEQEKLLKLLKKAHKLFGGVRDRDVLVEAFKKKRKAAEGKKQRKLLQSFIQIQKQERKRERAKLKKKLPRLIAGKLDQRWKAYMDSVIAVEMHEEQLLAYVNRLEEQFDHRRVSFEQLKQGEGMEHPETLKALHRVRLLVKELRYILKHADIVKSGEWSKKRQYYENLQEPLGEINDCRVWLERWKEVKPKELGAESKDYKRLISQLNEELLHKIGHLQMTKPLIN
jgi:CHAD domain-containing protein